jgi:hypothetical protein
MSSRQLEQRPNTLAGALHPLPNWLDERQVIGPDVTAHRRYDRAAAASHELDRPRASIRAGDHESLCHRGRSAAATATRNPAPRRSRMSLVSAMTRRCCQMRVCRGLSAPSSCLWSGASDTSVADPVPELCPSLGTRRLRQPALLPVTMLEERRQRVERFDTTQAAPEGRCSPSRSDNRSPTCSSPESRTRSKSTRGPVSGGISPSTPDWDPTMLLDGSTLVTGAGRSPDGSSAGSAFDLLWAPDRRAGRRV